MKRKIYRAFICSSPKYSNEVARNRGGVGGGVAPESEKNKANLEFLDGFSTRLISSDRGRKMKTWIPKDFDSFKRDDGVPEAGIANLLKGFNLGLKYFQKGFDPILKTQTVLFCRIPQTPILDLRYPLRYLFWGGGIGVLQLARVRGGRPARGDPNAIKEHQNNKWLIHQTKYEI